MYVGSIQGPSPLELDLKGINTEEINNTIYINKFRVQGRLRTKKGQKRTETYRPTKHQKEQKIHLIRRRSKPE